MKKTIWNLPINLLAIAILVAYIGLGSACSLNEIKYLGFPGELAKVEEQERLLWLEEKKFAHYNPIFLSTRSTARAKGYITIDELDPLKTFKYKAFYRFGPLTALQNEISDFFVELVDKNMLPFKAMFYLSLEKEDYEGAEIIRRNWLKELTILKNSGLLGNSVSIDLKLDKLNVIGLADPMLVKLRKELIIPLESKNWDDAQKIQNLIMSRMAELHPPQPPVIYGKRSGSSKTVVVLQQPSKQYVQVEQMPRYGAEDVGRAFSLLGGQGGALTGKEAGALKLLDILLGR